MSSSPLQRSAGTRSLRRDQALARVPQALLLALALVLMLAGLRSLLLGPRPTPVANRPPAQAPDLAAHGFAAEVARRYLSYDGASGQDRDDLAELAGSGLGAELGPQPASQGAQRVRWTDVVQDQPAIAGGRLITVAVMTDRRGLLHLSVPVRRDRQGRLLLAGYPAFVGAPTVAPRAELPARPSIADPELRQVAGRALANYLSGDSEDLQADLAPGARIALPELTLTVAGTPEVAEAGTGGVLVTVRARDRDDTHYALTYELGVTRSDRWYVTSIQTFPTQP